MTLRLRSYDVALAHDGIELEKAYEAGAYEVHRVTVMHADQLMGEQAGPRYGLGVMTASPMSYATLWVWAALKRTGVPELPEFPLFKARVLTLDLVQTEEGEQNLDPTMAGPGTGSP